MLHRFFKQQFHLVFSLFISAEDGGHACRDNGVMLNNLKNVLNNSRTEFMLDKFAFELDVNSIKRSKM